MTDWKAQPRLQTLHLRMLGTGSPYPEKTRRPLSGNPAGKSWRSRKGSVLSSLQSLSRLGPLLILTTSGTASAMACSMVSRVRTARVSSSASGTSSTSSS